MSFGAGSGISRGRRPADDDPCPCGSGSTFGGCCGPVLDGVPADSPQALMRSRYTAFALGDTEHVQRTWHPTTAPEALDLDEALRWERLEVLSASTDAAGRRGTVEFRAHWHDGSTGQRGVLHEVSRFRLAAGRWFYVDGLVD